MKKEGLLIVVSGPSGSGKGTLIGIIRRERPEVKYSVSVTSREPRSGEFEGVNYFFKSRVEFEKMIIKNELLEWVEYCNNYYGTPKKFIMEELEEGNDVVVEIEVEGAEKIFKEFPNCISIFILPPSLKELRKRILNRGTETFEVVDKRIIRAKEELLHVENYKYLVSNDEVVEASQILKAIIISEKQKCFRNKEIIVNILKEEIV